MQLNSSTMETDAVVDVDDQNGQREVNRSPSNLLSKLFDSVSGEAREGELLAVLGAAGSGKSTFIDALAGRIVRENLQGSITLNGDAVESRDIKVLSAYVMQDNLFYPMLTVKETLMYAAEFRLPWSVSKEKKKKRVEELIGLLGLDLVESTIIGDEVHHGLSGGERRRVSIGIDIVHDPILLFLNEPNFGLDSTNAFMVINALKEIAKRGSIVILSIHQPNNRIIKLLDYLLFLSNGRTVFYGPTSSLSVYFNEFGYPIAAGQNLTEFALDLIRYNEATAEGAVRLVEFNKQWRSEHRHLFFSDKEDILNTITWSLKDALAACFASGRLICGTDNPHNLLITSTHKFTNPFWIEVGLLTKRAFTNTNRMPELFMIQLGAVLVTSIILSTIYWKLDNTPKGVQERMGFFAIGMSAVFYTCADALPVYIQERYIERAHNAYRKSSFVFSSAVVGFPLLVFLSFGFALTTFFAVGLDGGMSGFFFYVAVIIASFWAGSGFVTFLSGLVSNVVVGYTIVVAILAYYLLFSGFFINRDRIPHSWIWFHYISLMKYPYQALLQNEFSDPGKCFVRGTQMFDNTPVKAFPEPTKVDVLARISSSLGLNLTSSTCITTGPNILERNSVEDLSKWNSLWITVAWGFFFRFLFYIVLIFGNKDKRQ